MTLIALDPFKILFPFLTEYRGKSIIFLSFLTAGFLLLLQTLYRKVSSKRDFTVLNCS
jgi:hypothetical protein